MYNHWLIIKMIRLYEYLDSLPKIESEPLINYK